MKSITTKEQPNTAFSRKRQGNGKLTVSKHYLLDIHHSTISPPKQLISGENGSKDVYFPQSILTGFSKEGNEGYSEFAFNF